MTTALENSGKARRVAGEAREQRSAGEQHERAERRKEAQEVAAWVRERFPLEKRSQATVALYMLRDIHGRGMVTVGMVRARMRAQDARFGLVEEGKSTDLEGCNQINQRRTR